ncbi:MAG: hypothetical protein QM487_16105 [Candidatus Marithrix sp.]
MRYNKTLGVAIAAILSGGIGLATASNLTFDITGDAANPPVYPNSSKESAITVASELVDSSGNIEGTIPETTVWFEFDRNANIGFDIYVDFTLSGATFGSINVTTDNPTLINYNTSQTSTAPISRISGGAGENTVRYLVQATKEDLNIESGDPDENILSNEDRMQFKFTLGEVAGLENNGGSVKLTAAWGPSAISSSFVFTETKSEKILSSSSGVSVSFDENTTPAQIDVTQGSKKFVDSGFSETTASLGQLIILGATTVKEADLASNYTITATKFGDNSKLVIKGGPFVASAIANDDGMYEGVFIEITGDDCVFDGDATPPDLPAILVEGDEATWELDADTIFNISQSTTDVDICVVVDADNETEINDTMERATGALTLDFDNGKSSTSVGRLDRTKRNGTACTLYNVPHKQASDKGFYRFINKTDNEATVWATIKDREGVEYLVDQELGTIVGNSTLVVNSDQLHDYAIEAGAAEEKPWIGRAILTINSNSTDMEAYALLRGKNTRSVLLPAGATTPPANIGPLINVSSGASGNGCD